MVGARWNCITVRAHNKTRGNIWNLPLYDWRCQKQLYMIGWIAGAYYKRFTKSWKANLTQGPTFFFLFPYFFFFFFATYKETQTFKQRFFFFFFAERTFFFLGLLRKVIIALKKNSSRCCWKRVRRRRNACVQLETMQGHLLLGCWYIRRDHQFRDGTQNEQAEDLYLSRP